MVNLILVACFVVVLSFFVWDKTVKPRLVIRRVRRMLERRDGWVNLFVVELVRCEDDDYKKILPSGLLFSSESREEAGKLAAKTFSDLMLIASSVLVVLRRREENLPLTSYGCSSLFVSRQTRE